jgi:hypothetical protein
MCRNIRTLFNFEPPATVLIRSLTTTSAPRDRDVEIAKARARSAERFSIKG